MMKALLLLAPILFLLSSCDQGTTIYVPVENVDGARTGTPVTINGLQVGTLVDVALDEQLTCWLTLNVEQSYQIGQEATFYLETTSLLGSKAIRIENPMLGETVNSGDSIRTPIKFRSLIESFSTKSDSTELKEFSRKAGEFFDSLLIILEKKH